MIGYKWSGCFDVFHRFCFIKHLRLWFKRRCKRKTVFIEKKKLLIYHTIPVNNSLTRTHSTQSLSQTLDLSSTAFIFIRIY